MCIFWSILYDPAEHQLKSFSSTVRPDFSTHTYNAFRVDGRMFTKFRTGVF